MAKTKKQQETPETATQTAAEAADAPAAEAATATKAEKAKLPTAKVRRGGWSWGGRIMKPGQTVRAPAAQIADWRAARVVE